MSSPPAGGPLHPGHQGRRQLGALAELADEDTDPLGAQAAGAACARNNVAVVVPCHRVVAHDASLGGFTGGLRTKRRLLQLEGTLSLLKS